MLRTNLDRWTKLMGLIIVALLIVVYLAALTSTSRDEDCAWDGVALAWLDENENGQWDEQEPPLPSVPFFVDDTYNNFKDVSQWAMSNARGAAHFYVWLPGCPRVEFEVYPELPTGYRLTTPGRLDAQEEWGEVLEFGFTRLPGVPTPTPRPSVPMTCVPHSPGPDRHWSFKSLIVAPDGTVWGTCYPGVFRFDLTSSSWTIFTTENGLPDAFIRAMVREPDGTLWVETTREVARFDGTTWTTYALEPGSTLGGIDKLVFEPDGDVWRISGDGLTKFGVTTPDGCLWSIGQLSLSQLIAAEETDAESDWIVRNHDYPEYEVFHTSGWPDLLVSADGTLWLPGRNYEGGWGLANFDPSTEEWTIFDPRTTHGALLGEEIYHLAVAPDGSVWVGTVRDGVIQLVPAQGGQADHAQVIYHAPDVLLDKNISTIAFGPDGSIWLGTSRSLIHCTLGDG